MPALTVKKAKELALKALCRKLRSGMGDVVTLAVKDFCRDSNPKPCGEALKALCLELGCTKVSKKKYMFRRADVSLNICRQETAHV